MDSWTELPLSFVESSLDTTHQSLAPLSFLFFFHTLTSLPLYSLFFLLSTPTFWLYFTPLLLPPFGSSSAFSVHIELFILGSRLSLSCFSPFKVLSLFFVVSTSLSTLLFSHHSFLAFHSFCHHPPTIHTPVAPAPDIETPLPSSTGSFLFNSCPHDGHVR
jgi:hypothetical protein